jgi:cytochrome c-type biogenesis protein CcmF
LLAILTFGLSLLGTFLVRSGVLTSVHAFASDPERGVFILLLLLIAIGGALALYAWRAPALRSGGLFRPVSREGAMVLNNLLLTTACATVFLGTLYPLFADLFGWKLSVGTPYFNLTFVPLMLPLLVALAAGPLLPWKRGDLPAAMAKLRWAGFVAIGAALAILVFWDWRQILAALGFGVAIWLIGGVVVEWAERVKLFRAPLGETLRRAASLPRSAWGMSIAHAAMGITVLGITASSAWQVEAIRAMKPGESVTVAGYVFAFKGVQDVRGPNYAAQRGVFEVTRGGAPVATLLPEKRTYPVERSATTEAAIHTTWLADLYAVLGDPDGKGAWAVRLYHNPLVPWIWIGAILMFVGAGVSLTDRRHRVGAPRRSRSALAAAPAE